MIGSLCSGVGMADLAAGLLGFGPLAWYCENDKDASRVMAARFPGVANLGDLTTVTWERVPPVDVVVAGYPCQTESLAGARRGADDERWIWPLIACALRILRPSLLLAENVPGHLSLGFRRVIGDLAAIGFDADWATLRASDVGACHQRNRLFVVAYPHSARVQPDPGTPRRDETDDGGGGQTDSDIVERHGPASRAGRRVVERAPADPGRAGREKAATSTDRGGHPCLS